MNLYQIFRLAVDLLNPRNVDSLVGNQLRGYGFVLDSPKVVLASEACRSLDFVSNARHANALA